MPNEKGEWAWLLIFQTPITHDSVVRNENIRHDSFRLNLKSLKMSLKLKSELIKFGTSGRKKSIGIDITFHLEQ